MVKQSSEGPVPFTASKESQPKVVSPENFFFNEPSPLRLQPRQSPQQEDSENFDLENDGDSVPIGLMNLDSQAVVMLSGLE